MSEDKNKKISDPIMEWLYPDEIQNLYLYRINKLMHFHKMISISCDNDEYLGNPIIGFCKVNKMDRQVDFETLKNWLNEKGLFGRTNLKDEERKKKGGKEVIM